MSTRSPSPQAARIEILPNGNDGTLTFVADRDEECAGPPTEWITIAKEDAVDLKRSQ